MAIIILDNIRSAYNVGAIFRTADAAGVEKIYLIGSTPTPIDRFGRKQTAINKTALGADEVVPWEHVGESTNESTKEALELLGRLKKDGYEVVAVEQTQKSILFSEYQTPGKVAYIFGSEVPGVQTELVEASDVVAELPMHGSKESLNVSVTAGIVLFRDFV